MATALAPQSRNRSAGELLAQGVPSAEIPGRVGQAIEAFETVPLLARAIERAGLRAPIVAALARLIDGTLPLSDWVELVRVSQPEPVRRRGRFRSWWRRLHGEGPARLSDPLSIRRCTPARSSCPCSCFAGLAPPAAAAETYGPVKGSNGPGPARYDRSYVLKVGPSSAKRILVLVPGTFGGAGDFRLVARDIVKRVPGLQVWAWDRRSQALEDTSVFAAGDPDAAFDYYLNFKAVGGKTFTPVDGARDTPYAREWGLETSLEDLRRVVLRAGAGGKRKVILGGHSLGGSTVMAYASWDFAGRPGYRDVDGLVLIDGALDSTRPRLSAADARTAKKAIDEGDPFADLLGIGLPWAAGVFAESGGLYARKRPNDRSALQDYPLLPDRFKPPFPVTNEGLVGLRLRRVDLTARARAAPRPRGGARAVRRPAALGRRRGHADPAARQDVLDRARERHRVVLPAPAPARPPGRVRADADPGRQGARRPRPAREGRQRAAARLRHRPDRRPRGRVRPPLRAVLAGTARHVRAGPALRAPRPADRRPVEESVPRCRRALPEAHPLRPGIHSPPAARLDV